MHADDLELPTIRLYIMAIHLPLITNQSPTNTPPHPRATGLAQLLPQDPAPDDALPRGDGRAQEQGRAVGRRCDDFILCRRKPNASLVYMRAFQKHARTPLVKHSTPIHKTHTSTHICTYGQAYRPQTIITRGRPPRRPSPSPSPSAPPASSAKRVRACV